jgi:hypothetical protein
LFLKCHHFDDLLARVSTVFAGVRDVVHTCLSTYIFTVRTYLRACLADITINRGAMLHEVCCRHTEFGTIEQKVHLIGILALHRICRVLADLSTIQAVLNTVLHLLLKQGILGILLHNTFFLFLIKTNDVVSSNHVYALSPEFVTLDTGEVVVSMKQVL